MRVGILALQGGFAAHARALRDLGHEPHLVRYAEQLDTRKLDGLVLPGGESSTMLKVLRREALDEPLDAFARSGKPVLATCAGLILAAREVTSPAQRSFGWIDVTVVRNGWGRQVASFEATADASDIPLMFIRAPRISRVGAATVALTLDAEPVLVRQGAIVGASFHPELTADRRIHAQVFGE